MPETGEYLLLHAGFSKDEKPVLSLQHHADIITYSPVVGTVLTFEFDTAIRYCVGWHDIKTGQSYLCKATATVDSRYDQCAACQQRTGFNPAFYHASSVSPQQEARNQQPHVVYLAHFGKGMIKVGISHAARGNARLLEQGARSALILTTASSALIARAYEAQIASLPGIAESLQQRTKTAALTTPYDNTLGMCELLATRNTIEQTLEKKFDKNDVMNFDAIYFPSALPHFNDACDMSNHNALSGHTLGMLGSLLFCEQQNTPIFLSLKKYTGYKLRLSYEITLLPLPARQTSLF
jgi:hypothetical protein